MTYLYHDTTAWREVDRWQWFELLAWATYARPADFEGWRFARVEGAVVEPDERQHAHL